MFIVVLLVKVQSWKKPKYSITHALLDKSWYIYAKEYYWEIKKNELLIYTQWFQWISTEFCWVKEANLKRLWFHLQSILKWQNYRDGEQISSCQILNDQVKERGVGDYKGYTRDSWMELSCILTMGSNHTSLHM